jgi:hypothetical protein
MINGVLKVTIGIQNVVNGVLNKIFPQHLDG